MLEVHSAHPAASTWRDFFIHIATIVFGLLIAVLVLLAAGCNSAHKVDQNPTPTSTPALSPSPVVNPAATSTNDVADLTLNPFQWCMAKGGVNETPNYNTPKVCTLNDKVYTDDCVDNDKYLIISQDKTDEVGTNILVKYKSSPGQTISCNYKKGSGDFQVVEDAAYVLALESNFLILDEGTDSDPRGLKIYDLNTRKKIYEDSYSEPFAIKNNVLDYWANSAIKVTTKSCPNLKKLDADGMGSAIDEHVSLNLLTLKKTDLGERRCSPRE